MPNKFTKLTITIRGESLFKHFLRTKSQEVVRAYQATSISSLNIPKRFTLLSNYLGELENARNGSWQTLHQAGRA